MSGPPRPLERVMRLPGVLFLTLSAATPASSFFVIVPDVLREAGTGALWAMAGAALVAAAVAQVYAELASAFPYAGGEYAIVARVLGPAPGFAMLAVNTANLVLGGAVLSLGVAGQLAAAIPGLPAAPVAIGCVALATALGVLDVRANAWVTGAFLLVEFAALAGVAALGFAHPARDLVAFAAAPPVVPDAGAGWSAVGPGALAAAGAVALFAYDGYGSAVYFAEELRDPRRQVARAVMWALGLVVATEALPLLAMLVGAPDLRALFREGPAAFVAARAGPGAGRTLGVAVALAIFNAVIALVLLAARQLYGAGRDEAFPPRVSRALAAVHPRFRSPWIATLAAGAVTAGLCLLPASLLTLMTGAGVTAIYAGMCVALLAGRRSGVTAAAAYRSPLFPGLPVATLLVLGAVLAFDGWEAGDGRTSLLVTAALAGLGALAGWRAAAGRRWRPTAPSDDLADLSPGRPEAPRGRWPGGRPGPA